MIPFRAIRLLTVVAALLFAGAASASIPRSTRDLSPISIAAATETPSYDGKGSLLADSRRQYTFNGLGWLSAATAASVTPNLSLAFDYDADGRRICKTVSILTNGNWIVSSIHQFTYDRWNLISETITTSGVTTLRHYTWGLDLSGLRNGQPGQSSGGIAALLAIAETSSLQPAVTNLYLPVCDHHGSILLLLNAASGATVAQYDYDPYGVLISQSGPQADTCPFRFTSKYYDTETSLYYFGHRYFDPASTKWLTADPLQDQAGPNWTAYCNDDPVNKTDPLGLEMGEIKNPDMLPFVPTPQGYSPYYYGTTIPETAYAQVANLFSLVNNTVLVGLQNLNVATEKTGLNTAIMAMPMTAPIVKAPRMLVELEEIAQTEQVLTKVSTVEKANIATRDVLTVARSDAFISAAIKQGYGAQLASLEAKISTLGSLGKIRYSWSFGARLTPSELTIGRMRLLFSKDTKIRHELGHMLQDISSGGKLLESEAQLSLSEVKNLEQQAYRMQGSSVISAELQATLNALANKYPRTTYGVATGATGAIIIYEIVGDK